MPGTHIALIIPAGKIPSVILWVLANTKAFSAALHAILLKPPLPQLMASRAVSARQLSAVCSVAPLSNAA